MDMVLTGGACVNRMIQKRRRQSFADCFPHSWQEVAVVDLILIRRDQRRFRAGFDVATHASTMNPACRVPGIQRCTMFNRFHRTTSVRSMDIV
jgi:hypothetical protein